MSQETLGWIFIALIGVYTYATIKWVIIDRIKELRDVAKNENQNGDGI